MNTNLEHKMIETNGVKLHVVFAGPEDGEPVILLHGFPEFWRGWLKQIGPLADAGYRVIVPDQRGYNLSDKPEGVSAYHIDTLAHDILGLIKATGRESVFVIGHDWGAAVAWHLGIYYPDSIKKLMILNVPHPKILMGALRKSFAQMRKSWYMFFFQIPRLPEWILGRNDAQAAADLLQRSGKEGSFSDEDLRFYREAWGQPGALRAMIHWYRSAIRSSFSRAKTQGRSGSARVSAPTLMLWGKQDVALGSEMAQPSIDLCSDGELIFFDNATHWVQHDEAEAVTRYLLKFLK